METTTEINLENIEKVTSSRDRKEFLDFPYLHYKDDKYWVPPLYMEQKKLIDTKKNPFYLNADIELFLARKNGKVVGRIAAIEDRRFNEYHDNKVGFFGFFECINDQHIAGQLFQAAENWLKDRGLEAILGPSSPSMMDEIGVLVEGFDKYPSIMMPYSKSYYDKLIKNVGLGKVMDLYAFRVSQDTVNRERIERAEAIVKRRMPNLKIREVNLKDLNNEVHIIRDIFNKTWSENWGFIPLSKEEFDDLAKDLKTIVNTDFAHIAEVEGDPVAFSIALPDFNQALKHLNGKLLPFGIFKLLYYQSKISRIRTALMGVLPEYQGRGIDALMHKKAIDNGYEKGFHSSELGWVLETNTNMIRVAERLGAHREKTYRMYQRLLT